MSDYIEKLERSLRVVLQLAKKHQDDPEAFEALIDASLSLRVRIADERKREAEHEERKRELSELFGRVAALKQPLDNATDADG